MSPRNSALAWLLVLYVASCAGLAVAAYLARRRDRNRLDAVREMRRKLRLSESPDLRRIAEWSGGQCLHGFGVKRTGRRRFAHQLESADTIAERSGH
jgi:hypothetical protein